MYGYPRALQEIQGAQNSVWKQVASEEEGWAFIADHQEATLLDISVIPPPPVTLAPPPPLTLAASAQPKVSSLQKALKVPREDPSGAFIAGASLSGMNGRASGPDPSQKMEGKVFSLLITDEFKL